MYWWAQVLAVKNMKQCCQIKCLKCRETYEVPQNISSVSVWLTFSKNETIGPQFLENENVTEQKVSKECSVSVYFTTQKLFGRLNIALWWFSFSIGHHWTSIPRPQSSNLFRWEQVDPLVSPCSRFDSLRLPFMNIFEMLFVSLAS